jgi:predicted  nucleic acid-binding Zn-ribbon protein
MSDQQFFNSYLQKLKAKYDQEVNSSIVAQIQAEQMSAEIARLNGIIAESTESSTQILNDLSLAKDSNENLEKITNNLVKDSDLLIKNNTELEVRNQELLNTVASHAKEISRLRNDCERLGIALAEAQQALDYKVMPKKKSS